MDAEERKIAIICVVFDEINISLKTALARLKQAVDQVQLTVAKTG